MAGKLWETQCLWKWKAWAENSQPLVQIQQQIVTFSGLQASLELGAECSGDDSWQRQSSDLQFLELCDLTGYENMGAREDGGTTLDLGAMNSRSLSTWTASQLPSESASEDYTSVSNSAADYMDYIIPDQHQFGDDTRSEYSMSTLQDTVPSIDSTLVQTLQGFSSLPCDTPW